MLLERLILTTMERRGKEKKYQQIEIEVRGFERLQNRYEERKTETLEESVSRSTGVGTSVFFERCQEKLVPFQLLSGGQIQLHAEIKSRASQNLFSLQ